MLKMLDDKKKMDKFLKYWSIFCAISLIIGFLIDNEVRIIILSILIIFLDILLVRMYYKTSEKNGYLYNNFINKEICSIKNKKYFLIEIVFAYVLSFLIFCVNKNFSGIYCFNKNLIGLFFVVLIFGFIISFSWLKTEKFRNNREKLGKYSVYFALYIVIVFPILCFSYITLVNGFTEYITKNEMIYMVDNINNKFSKSGVFHYVSHSEECDLYGKSCKISIFGYFDGANEEAGSVGYFRDKKGNIEMTAIAMNLSKDEVLKIKDKNISLD